MKTSFFSKLFVVIAVIATSLVTVVPTQAATPQAAAIPGFEKFVTAVSDGNASTVRGVYVPGVLALRVKQQPAGNAGYVSSAAGVATQFGMAAEMGTTGLLAHNFAAGKSYSNLAIGNEVKVVYGDGSVKTYIVSAIYQYQALDSNNPYGDLVDLSTGVQMPVADVFNAVYGGGDHVTFQTCIAKNGNASWGRLFVVATPAP
jgi:hypothetical protein